MPGQSYPLNYFLMSNAIVIIQFSIVIMLSSSIKADSSINHYPSIFYKNSLHHSNSLANISKEFSEPRNGGSRYSVSAGSSNFGSSAGGGYNIAENYGASSVPLAAIYKHHLYPGAKQKQSHGWGWGSGDNEDDDDSGDFPVELIGLLGLKGLKGLKGLTGLLGLLKGLLLLKKLLAIPLLPLLFPLFLLKLGLKILLILLFPVPVLVTTTGRRQNVMKSSEILTSFKIYLQDKLESLIVSLPQDINHIVEKITKSSIAEEKDDVASKNKQKDYMSNNGAIKSTTNKL